MRVRTMFVTLAVLATALLVAPHADAQQMRANAPFKLAPGGTANVNFHSFCLDYGKKFPEQVGLPPTTVADPQVAGGLSYAIDKGYVNTDPKQVQFAIWELRGADAAPEPGPIGQEIVQKGSVPTAPEGATSLIDAINNNQVRVTAESWQGVGEKLTINGFDDFFQGQGQLKIANTSNQTLDLYLPTGAVFPASSAEFQSMAGYVTNIAVNNPEQLMPQTGLDGLTGFQLLLIGLIAIDVAGLGLLLQRRALK